MSNICDHKHVTRAQRPYLAIKTILQHDALATRRGRRVSPIVCSLLSFIKTQSVIMTARHRRLGTSPKQSSKETMHPPHVSVSKSHSPSIVPRGRGYPTDKLLTSKRRRNTPSHHQNNHLETMHSSYVPVSKNHSPSLIHHLSHMNRHVLSLKGLQTTMNPTMALTITHDIDACRHSLTITL